jgi:hypothetical protein
MAAVFVRRRAGRTAWRGALLATVGLVGMLALTNASDSQSLTGPQRLFLAVVTGGSVVALVVSAHAAHRHPAVRSVLVAAAAGIAFGIASVFTKTVALDWTGGSALTPKGVALLLPSLGVVAVLAAAGMLLSQASYRGAGLAAPLSMVTVANPVVAAAVGLTLFGEGFRYGWTGTGLALGSAAVAAGGLVLLTTERINSVPPSPDRPGAPVAAGDGAGTPRSATVRLPPSVTLPSPDVPSPAGAEGDGEDSSPAVLPAVVHPSDVPRPRTRRRGADGGADGPLMCGAPTRP